MYEVGSELIINDVPYAKFYDTKGIVNIEHLSKEVKCTYNEDTPKRSFKEFFVNLKKWNEKESAPVKKKVHNVILIEGTDEVVMASDIIIPDDFKNSPPRFSKLNKYANYYRKYGCFDKPITVIPETNENGEPNNFVLVDGYAKYYFATKWFKFKWLPVKYISIEEYCNNEKYATS